MLAFGHNRRMVLVSVSLQSKASFGNEMISLNIKIPAGIELS